jgi:hypothetical protein
MDDPLMLDANAVAGDLAEIFGFDVTASVHRCTHCGNRGALATLLAFVQGPGVVLRCCVCHEIVMRWVRTPTRVYFDARGAAYMEMGAP